MKRTMNTMRAFTQAAILIRDLLPTAKVKIEHWNSADEDTPKTKIKLTLHIDDRIEEFIGDHNTTEDDLNDFVGYIYASLNDL